MSATGWTSHGHRVAGVPTTLGRPPVPVMRCGGPGMCATCAREATAQQAGARSLCERCGQVVQPALPPDQQWIGVVLQVPTAGPVSRRAFFAQAEAAASELLEFVAKTYPVTVGP